MDARFAQTTTTTEGENEYVPTSILLTGGCGFMGSCTLNMLVCLYPHVQFVNIDRLDYCASVQNVLVAPRPNYAFYEGDIKDTFLVHRILETHKIDTVMHFAAQTHVDLSFGNSLSFTNTNVLGTHHLLETCQSYGKIRRFIHISTDEVYGSILEGKSCGALSVLNPTNPYAASKAAAEHIVNAYYHSFRMPAIIVRSNNVFGPRQFPDKVFPKFLMHLLRGEKCTVHGKGETRRNFIYVDDFARAVEIVLLRGKVGQIYDIGTDNELSVMDVVQALQRGLHPQFKHPSLHETAAVVEYVEDRKFNDHRYAVDASKLKALGWRELVPFPLALQQTIQWYKALYERTQHELSTYWPSLRKEDETQQKRRPPKLFTLLLYGANGVVGRDLQRHVSRLTTTVKDERWEILNSTIRLDDMDSSKLKDELTMAKEVGVHAVVCSVGRTGASANHLLSNVSSNLYAPVRLAHLCKQLGLYLVYIGTGCIFNDTDETEPFTGNDYSTMKGYTDRLLREFFSDSVFNVRIRMPIFGPQTTEETKEPRDYLAKLKTYYDRKSVVMDIANSFSVMPTLWPLFLELVKRKHVGTLNLCNPGGITNREILSDYMKLPLLPESETRTTMPERCFYVTDTSRLQELFPQVHVPTIREALGRLLSSC